MPDKEGWPVTPKEYIAWDRDIHASRAVTDTVLYEFLTWLKGQGYEIGEDNYGGTFGGLVRVDPERLKAACRKWIKERYG